MQDKDFDLDLPKNCDDEYWENVDNPEQNFRQPPERPAATDFFIHLVKLNQIIALALDTIYAVDKSKVPRVYPKGWEQTIVAKLDSALNKWLEEVPDHLRWNPTREDPLFFNQSATLYASYYYVQILVHRPFIPSPHKASTVSFPSLAICTNAARSCSSALLLQYERFPDGLLNQYAFPGLMSSSIVLLLSIRSGASRDVTQEMIHVYRCMGLLKSMEERWLGAGCLWDVLHELVTVGDLPSPDSDPSDSRKRRRDSDSGYAPGRSPLQGHIDFDPVPTGGDLARWLSTNVSAQEDKSASSPSNQPPLFSNDSTPGFFTTMLTTPIQHAPLDTFTGKYQPSISEETNSNVPNVVDVWSTAPTNFELDEWGAYIMEMIERESLDPGQ